MIGRVVSTKMVKTAVVLIESTKKHPLYHKTFRRSKKYLADNNLTVSEGDIVEISKVKPLSRLKHWKVIKVLGKDIEAQVTEKLKEQAAEVIEEVMPEEEKAVEESTGVSRQREKKPEVETKTQKQTRRKTTNGAA